MLFLRLQIINPCARSKLVTLLHQGTFLNFISKQNHFTVNHMLTLTDCLAQNRLKGTLGLSIIDVSFLINLELELLCDDLKKYFKLQGYGFPHLH